MYKGQLEIIHIPAKNQWSGSDHSLEGFILSKGIVFQPLDTPGCIYWIPTCCLPIFALLQSFCTRRLGSKCSIHKSPNMAYMVKFKSSQSWWLATFCLPRGDAGYTLHGQRSFLRRSIWSKRHPCNFITKPLCPYRDLEKGLWSHIYHLLHPSTSKYAANACCIKETTVWQLLSLLSKLMHG